MTENSNQDVQQVEQSVAPEIEQSVDKMVATPETQEAQESKKEADVNAAFAAVKKEFREKGRREAQEEFKQLLEQQNSEQQTAPATPQQVNTQQEQPLTMSQVRQMQWLDKAERINIEGKQKYSDYEKRVENIAEKVAYNPTLQQLMGRAYEIGGADTIYKLSTDANFRGQLLDSSPQEWDSKIFAMNSQPADMKQTAPPIDDVKSTPATGNKTLTPAERRRRSFEKNGRSS